LENAVTLLDCVEVWVKSLRGVFKAAEVAIHFERTSDGRPKNSCVLNLRQHLVEADFIVWDSGEADLAFTSNPGVVTQEHFECLGDLDLLSAALARVMTIIRVAPAAR
jgi:hypothetical protein